MNISIGSLAIPDLSLSCQLERFSLHFSIVEQFIINKNCEQTFVSIVINNLFIDLNINTFTWIEPLH